MFVYYRLKKYKFQDSKMRKKDDEKRNNIKKAVVEVILEEGMNGASISKIAKSAGVSPATVYIY